jgi:biotin carboxylase
MVVGAGWKQVPIIKEAKRRGFFVITIDGNPKAYGLRFGDKAFVISTRDREGVLERARSEGIHAITYMITESPIPAVYYVADALGLPGPSRISAEVSVNKIAMRDLFRGLEIPNPKFGKATCLEEARAVARRIGFPLVVKPADVGGQLGLFQIEQPDDLENIFESSKGKSLGGEVILEERLEGDEINVVAIVLDGEVRTMVISDRIKHPSLAFGVVTRHLYPTACSGETKEKIREMTQQIVSAMRIENGIVFPQFILGERCVKVVEVGERIPGGIMMELFQLATGYDLVKLQLDISLGKPSLNLPDYKVSNPYDAVTVKFLTARPGPLKVGNVSQLVGREEALELDYIIEADYYNGRVGKMQIRPLREGRDRFYYIVAVGSTREQAVRRSERAFLLMDFLDANGNSLKC